MPGTYRAATWAPHVGRPYEYKAFIPRPLSDRLTANPLSSESVGRLDDALTRLGELPSAADLGDLGVHLGRAEAGGSSMIEGHYTGARRVYEHRFDPEASQDRRVLPVFDNWRVVQRVRDVETLTVNELLEWHRLLMDHDPRSQPGQFRQRQNWIGGGPFGPRNATYVPPPPEEIGGLVDELAEYARTGTDQPVMKAAAIHAQFESIHPFVDGNGRVGRALIQWVLRGVAPSVPPLALVWYGHSAGYFESLNLWRATADTAAWFDYFARSLREAIDGSHRLVDDLGELVARWQAAAPARAGSLKRRLIDDLVANPIVDAETAGDRLDATPSRFSRTARELCEAGILTETSLPRRRRGQPLKVYEARELFGVLDTFVETFRPR